MFQMTTFKGDLAIMVAIRLVHHTPHLIRVQWFLHL